MHLKLSQQEALEKIRIIEIIEKSNASTPILGARLARIREKLQSESRPFEDARKKLFDEMSEEVIVFFGEHEVQKCRIELGIDSKPRFAIAKALVEANPETYANCERDAASNMNGIRRIRSDLEDAFTTEIESLLKAEIEIDFREIPLNELDKEVWDTELKIRRPMDIPQAVISNLLCFFEKE